MKKLPLILLSMLLAVCAHAADAPRDIHSFDWTSYFNQQYPECLENDPDRKQAVELQPIAYYDFDHDGSPEALVTGASCNTGTAGSDIHAVYAWNPDGTVTELKFSRDEKHAQVTGVALPPIGNDSQGLAMRGELLCIQSRDGSGPEISMEECYEFRNKQFVLTSITYAPTYETSFDCRKASKDREIVVCRNAEAAGLDLQLAQEYAALLRTLPPSQKASLMASQRRWLQAVNAWTAYKWTDEVVEKYRERIEELHAYSKPAAGVADGESR